MGKLKAETLETLNTAETLKTITSGADEEQRAYWMRDNALSHALALHKINGGMKNVNQVLADAVVILEFLKGKNDE